MHKKNLILFLSSFISFSIDRLTKCLIKNFLKVEGASFTIIDHFLYITYIKNRGGVFGVLQDKGWIFTISGIILVILISIFYLGQKKPQEKIGAGLIIGGACGNIYDRIIEGGVIDFISFTFYPTFNLADVFILIGCFILILTKIK